LSIQGIIWAIEQEEKGKTKKKNSITPRYFSEWLEYVEPDCIVKTEKILAAFEAELSQPTEKSLKKAVLALNKLEEKLGFIYTIEAENLHEKLIELATKKGLSDKLAAEIIDENRDW
jgi:hypothetical protein